jgi:hypothetical protein
MKCIDSVLKSMAKKDGKVKVKEVSRGKKIAMPRK